MSDRVFIRDLRLRGIIGILPEERHTPQEIVVNVSMLADTHPAAASGAIEQAIDYAAVAAAIGDHVSSHRPRLVETLAADLAALILATQPRVAAVRVRVEKPEALEEAAGVGVEIERKREAPSTA